MKLYTPEQYILRAVSRYPTLFAGYDYDDTKFRVLDQLLNVNGNGIRNDKELLEHLEYHEFDEVDAARYTTGEPVYYGYYEVIMIGDTMLPAPGGESISVLESDRDQHPDVKLWREVTRYKRDPYPNFKKDYSIVWRSDFKALGPEWCKAAIWFYTKCRGYFLGDCRGYHYSFPKYDTYLDRDVTDRTLKDFQERIAGKYESYEALSEAYGVEGYNGDDYDFLSRRWQREKNRILTYINETIKYLELNNE